MICSLLAAASIASGPQAMTLEVRGTKLINERGREVWLQGVNLPFLRDHVQAEAYRAHFLNAVKQKSNVVRLPLSLEQWMGVNGGQGDEYRLMVQELVAIGKEMKVAVILDLRSPNSRSHLGLDQQRDFKMPPLGAYAFWRSVATFFRKDGHVLFDLYSRPGKIEWNEWREESIQARCNPQLTSIYQAAGMKQMLNIIRSTGAKNVVIASGTEEGYSFKGLTRDLMLSDKVGRGIIYSSHVAQTHEDWKENFAVVSETAPLLVSEEAETSAAMPGFNEFKKSRKVHWTKSLGPDS